MGNIRNIGLSGVVDNTVKKILMECDRRKDLCLSFIINEVIHKAINKKIARRITMISISWMPFYEKYILDEGKESEVILMDWDLEFRDGFPNIIVNSIVDVSHLI